MDTVEVCRTCMNERGSELVGEDFYSIFSPLEDDNVYIADCLAEWVGRPVDENDGMPSNICQPCLEAIKSIAFFIENAKECDSKLRTLRFRDNSDVGLLSYDDLDIKFEAEDISADVLLKRASDEEQTKKEPMKQEDTDVLTISDEEEAEDQGSGEEEAEDQGSDEEEEEDENSTEEDEDEASAEEESIKQEDTETSLADTDEDDEEESSKRRRKSARNISKKRREASLETPDELDEKERDTYKIIKVRNKLICCGCYLLFDNEADLEQHGKSLHEEIKRRNNSVNLNKSIVCKFCYRRFDRETQRQRHRKKFESIDKVYECKKCDKRIINAAVRYKHAHDHPEWKVAFPKMYSVPMSRLEKYGYLCCVRNCLESHNSEDALLEHVKKDHSLNRNSRVRKTSCGNQCPFCLRYFKSKPSLIGHYINRYRFANHHSDYQCHQCGKVYSSRALLKAHENKHADVKPHECDVCFKRYYSEAVLKQHKLIHTQSKSLACSICGMAFRTKMFLDNHYRVHSDDKPFVCDVCHKPFRHSSSLFTHKKIHYPSMQYKCSECGKGFTDTANLKRHMVSHTGIKPYQCSVCDKRFMRLTEKSEHESTVHMGVMPYDCEACGKQFPTKRTFQKHQQTCTF